MITVKTLRETQQILSMGPFSGSQMYIMLWTRSELGFEGATFGFKGKMVDLHTREDVKREITDREPILILNGDELFGKSDHSQALEAFFHDMVTLRHRHMVVVHRKAGQNMSPALANRFIHIECQDPIIPETWLTN